MDKQQRGFRVMSPEVQREIASKGGKAAHENGRAYKFTPEKAAEAARKGWENRRKRAGTAPQDPI